MNIVRRKTRRSGDPIYVFEFVNEEDKNFWIDKWKECAKYVCVANTYDAGYIEDFIDVIDTLKNASMIILEYYSKMRLFAL